VEEPATKEAPAVEEASAVEETAVAWRSRPRRAVVGGGVEDPATPGRGGARGGADCRGGGGVEEPAMPGCSWTGVVGGRTSQGGGGWVPTLDDGVAAAAIDLSEWAWTRGRAGRAW
jgi:hypothetical protein